jgi:hypothetical protein
MFGVTFLPVLWSPAGAPIAGVPGPRRSADECDAGWFAPVATRRRSMLGVFIPSPPARSICPRGPPHHRCAPVRRHLRRLGGGTVRPPLALAAAREATACWRTPAGACVRVCLPRRNRWRVPGSLLRSGLLGIAQPLACSRQPLRSRLLANAQPLMCLSLRALDRSCVPDFRRRSGRGPFMVGDLLLLSPQQIAHHETGNVQNGPSV